MGETVRKGNGRQKRNSQLYTIPRRFSSIKENGDIDTLERGRRLRLIVGAWHCIYCSAQSWQIRKIVFHDRNQFSITIQVGPLTSNLRGHYILQADAIYFSVMDQLLEAEYQVSDEMLTVENEIVQAMYVKQ